MRQRCICQHRGGAGRRRIDPRQGGPDGLGWPFGRSVTQSEILQVIRDVPGVDYSGEIAGVMTFPSNVSRWAPVIRKGLGQSRIAESAAIRRAKAANHLIR